MTFAQIRAAGTVVFGSAGGDINGFFCGLRRCVIGIVDVVVVQAVAVSICITFCVAVCISVVIRAIGGLLCFADFGVGFVGGFLATVVIAFVITDTVAGIVGCLLHMVEAGRCGDKDHSKKDQCRGK